MEKYITFDDVLIKPQFSRINSRRDVDLSTKIGELSLSLPIISANMDTVTNADMAIAMHKNGAIGALHRFSSIEKNSKAYKRVKAENADTIISIGLGDYEFERAETLINDGANILCIDVAHGAQIAVVEQYNKIASKHKNVGIIVGNFATGDTVKQFRELCVREPMAFKVGIGGGSACLTRVQTGCGIPQLSAVIDCVKLNPTTAIISDGGKKNPGDIAKALSVGAVAVMLGSMLAGVDEGPGDIIDSLYKQYRGSASQESYEVQGKVAKWRTFEGDSFLVPYKGSIADVLQNIEGGLRSSFAYVGAKNITEFQAKADLIEISTSTIKENSAHGKNQ
ncbi:MAG: guanosine monophosphate reductase [Alphaproteobacteria bacterium]|jgi:IMP dehydrogenase|nr:guanosine monophosphate reductase [Alphaproteobacteria bacterium]